MEYLKLEEINKTLAKTDIKGKDYVEVNERVKAFWKLCPEGRIETEIYSLENGIITIQAKVYENKLDEKPRATGIAQEKEGSTFINKTSYVENCETSAVGRALGNAGIGIDTSIASAEEVENAIINQDREKPITKLMAEALKDSIVNNNIENDIVIEELKKLGYTKLVELKVSEVQEFRKNIGIGE